MLRIHDDISIVLGGSAGQGIQTIESLLMSSLASQGYHVFATKEYMSRIRGGSNSTEIRITSKKRASYIKRIDLLIPLDEAVLNHLEKRITPKTLVLADAKSFKKKYPHAVLDVPFGRMAGEFGNPVFANTIAIGVVLGMMKIETTFFESLLRKLFGRKGEEIVRKNIEAGEAGYKLGEHLAFLQGLDIQIPRRKKIQENILLSGNDALGMGVLAAGCNFISSYPMSPGTTLLTFLAQHGRKFGIAVEQVEDEISAINMTIGASYAGARAIVTTSGGGFALMEEGVSLSGMIETPVVIHIAMRPGPATGLPTRTEQADLNLALYSGHGEFPRAIFAPGNQEEIFEVAQQAFHIADKYQSPVFILTDQYLLDAVGSVSEKDLKRLPMKNMIIETKKDYVRYALTKNGISPRGIPGFGEGLVVVDSDEHTEDGHLTEDLEMRVKMMDKRMKKLEGMQKEVLKPVISGADKGKILIVGWGSTKSVIAEALEVSGRADIATLHFKQVFPLPKNLAAYFDGAKKIIVIENNFTGQFANLLKQEGIKVTDTILKYNGEPFCMEELTEKFKKL
jgi:2-oxoglutarate ferredoxin oxidoreductase subunit alpha